LDSPCLVVLSRKIAFSGYVNLYAHPSSIYIYAVRQLLVLKHRLTTTLSLFSSVSVLAVNLIAMPVGDVVGTNRHSVERRISNG
jgi:hypothetical protein